MESISSNIPRSLQPYLEQFRKEPERAIQRLEKRLKKRGPDAAAWYLLSWLCYSGGRREDAIRAAWNAKILAPGSPAMEHLHYFMTHPKTFRAWQPDGLVAISPPAARRESAGLPSLDLDQLIDRLSDEKATRIRIDESAPEPDEDLGVESSRVEDIVTETLAQIHEQQGNKEAAIVTYERLMDLYTHKSGHYRAQIERLKSDIDSDGNET
ncbi:MAG: hypothetical protein WDZ29_01040 [Balneolaceae bacterium]